MGDILVDCFIIFPNFTFIVLCMNPKNHVMFYRIIFLFPLFNPADTREFVQVSSKRWHRHLKANSSAHFLTRNLLS